ncbi:MAG: hypothetical protein J5858_06405, partial [Lentisphaeria bacterium]|nr:hypothetical protein [Lentisphaeria bacterium]
MRSFFCEKCNLEFDLDEDFDEDDNTVFCPQCKINLARILPETPERILMRAKRQEEARRKALKKLFRLILITLIVVSAVNILILSGGKSFFLMLTAGLISGIPAGLWIRRITSDRTYRAGLLAGCLVSLVLAADLFFIHFIGLLPVFYPALRNLFGG